MSRPILAGLFPVLLALAACQNQPPAPPAPPLTPSQFASIRADYRRDNPDARVGLVTAVLPNANLASVGKTPVRDFRIGDVITFVDSEGRILTMGKVEAIESASLDVRYDDPAKAGRVPAIGDLAVRAIP